MLLQFFAKRFFFFLAHNLSYVNLFFASLDLLFLLDTSYLPQDSFITLYLLCSEATTTTTTTTTTTGQILPDLSKLIQFTRKKFKNVFESTFYGSNYWQKRERESAIDDGRCRCCPIVDVVVVVVVVAASSSFCFRVKLILLSHTFNKTLALPGGQKNYLQQIVFEVDN